MTRLLLPLFALVTAIALFVVTIFSPIKAQTPAKIPDLWQIYETTFKSAKYVDVNYPTLPLRESAGF